MLPSEKPISLNITKFDVPMGSKGIFPDLRSIIRMTYLSSHRLLFYFKCLVRDEGSSSSCKMRTCMS